MEQRLFTAACIMYAFTLVTRYLNKKGKLKDIRSFSYWHASFLLLILGCALYVFLFVMSGGEQIALSKWLVGTILVFMVSLYGFLTARKANEEKKSKLMKMDLEWSNTVYFAGFVASIVMFFFIQAFKIPSASMRDTLLEGDQLFVNKASYGFRIPFTQFRFWEFNKIKPGDVIVFRFPAEDRTQQNCGGSQYGKDFVKRVIAMPGDTVEVIDSRAYVNGKLLPQQPYEKYEPVERFHFQEEVLPSEYQYLWETHQLDSYYGLYLRDQFGPVVVPEGTYFALGDNRDDSCDSRFWGPVPRENIKGRAWFIHWPISRIRLIK